MADSRGVEPHPISENRVFKARRRTNPAALLSIFLVGVVGVKPTLSDYVQAGQPFNLWDSAPTSITPVFYGAQTRIRTETPKDGF